MKNNSGKENENSIETNPKSQCVKINKSRHKKVDFPPMSDTGKNQAMRSSVFIFLIFIIIIIGLNIYWIHRDKESNFQNYLLFAF